VTTDHPRGCQINGSRECSPRCDRSPLLEMLQGLSRLVSKEGLHRYCRWLRAVSTPRLELFFNNPPLTQSYIASSGSTSQGNAAQSSIYRSAAASNTDVVITVHPHHPILQEDAHHPNLKGGCITPYTSSLLPPPPHPSPAGVPQHPTKRNALCQGTQSAAYQSTSSPKRTARLK
jgi:hypothetical protein